MLAGFGLVAMSGLLMFAANPNDMLANRAFLLKLGLVSLAGLQLMALMAHPWVPGFLSRRPLPPERLARFRDRSSGLLRRLEKISRPRRLRLFVDTLLRWNASINLVARGDIPLLWSRHIADSVQLGSLLGPLVTGLVFPITGQGGVFALGALCFAIAAGVVWLFGMETRGKTLEELTE